jgi:arginyl-tRNA synthetase
MLIKEKIKNILLQVLSNLVEENILNKSDFSIKIDTPPEKSLGDFSTNIAMILAKKNNLKPAELANIISERVKDLTKNETLLNNVNVVNPGFINFYVNQYSKYSILETILKKGECFGQSTIGNGKNINIEFVSANPTGPLHVGHGRGAVYGSTLASVLKNSGYNVVSEYYVNDAGRQMDILTTSVWLRYMSLQSLHFNFPSNGYKGEYVVEIALDLVNKYGFRFVPDFDKNTILNLFNNAYPDEVIDNEGNVLSGDKEKHIDSLIEVLKLNLGEKYNEILNFILKNVLKGIKKDLIDMNVNFEIWFHETELFSNGEIDKVLKTLKDNDKSYYQEGAIWFKSTEYNDEKNRVLVRSNGIKTYFASDIAYHQNKLNRGFDKVINIWGSDHHGYIPRVRAALEAIKEDNSKLDIILVQFATLYRNKEKVPMSTRSGEFVTLKELYNEIGVDATRFFYVMRKIDQHMDFDLEVSKLKSNDNPLYYIQYAHARCCGIFLESEKRNLESWNIDKGLNNSALLINKIELELIDKISKFTDITESAARNYEPHLIAYYLRDLAQLFHNYYNNNQFLVENFDLRMARLTLVESVKIVLKNGLTLLGVSAPVVMK